MIYDVRRLHLHEKAHGIDLTMTLIMYVYMSRYILEYILSILVHIMCREEESEDPYINVI